MRLAYLDCEITGTYPIYIIFTTAIVWWFVSSLHITWVKWGQYANDIMLPWKNGLCGMRLRLPLSAECLLFVLPPSRQSDKSDKTRFIELVWWAEEFCQKLSRMILLISQILMADVLYNILKYEAFQIFPLSNICVCWQKYALVIIVIKSRF